MIAMKLRTAAHTVSHVHKKSIILLLILLLLKSIYCKSIENLLEQIISTMGKSIYLYIYMAYLVLYVNER